MTGILDDIMVVSAAAAAAAPGDKTEQAVTSG